jgi:two-component system, NtrC family, sensor kinase
MQVGPLQDLQAFARSGIAQMQINYREFSVLYVDDEPANLTAFRYSLEDQFQVLTASGAEEALRLLATEKVAVLLSDQRMPGMTGSRLCAKVRDLYTDIVRMVVSAYADLSATLEAINNGQVSRYILKPWREEELAATLRTAVEAFQIGALVRSLQTRLLHSEQHIGAQVAMDKVLHELSNPASSLGMNLRYAVDAIGKPGAGTSLTTPVLEDVRRSLADAFEASRSLDERLNYFVSGGALTPRPDAHATDLRRAVMSAVAIVRSEVRTRARLQVDVDPVPPVAIETVQASQVLVNLLVNAYEAIAPGAPEKNHVSVRVRPAPKGALVEVEDSGCGIATDMLAHVFEPFVTRKDQRTGHGLGLAIVREIVDANGGKVSVRSQVGRGTTFSVELLAAPPKADTPPKGPDQAHS